MTGDLRAWRERAVSLAEVARVGAAVARELAAPHAAGTAHGDVRLENILMDGDIPRLTGGGTGTPADDLHALGGVLYELCGGTQLPDRPDGVPDPLWNLIGWLRKENPQARPRSAQRVAAMLDEMARDFIGLPIPATRPTAPRPGTEPAAGLVVVPPGTGPAGAAGSPAGGGLVPPPGVGPAGAAESPPGGGSVVPSPGVGSAGAAESLSGGGLVPPPGAGPFGAGGSLSGGGLVPPPGVGSTGAGGSVPGGGLPPPVAPPAVVAPVRATRLDLSPAPVTTPRAVARATPRPLSTPPPSHRKKKRGRWKLLLALLLLLAGGVAYTTLRPAAKEAESAVIPTTSSSIPSIQSTPAAPPATVAPTSETETGPVERYVDELEPVAGRWTDVSDPMAIAGQTHLHTLAQQLGYCDTAGDVEYNLSKGYRKLTATAGIDDNARISDAKAQLEIYGDDKQLTSVTVEFGVPTPVDVDVTGVLRLRIHWQVIAGPQCEFAGYLVLGEATLSGLPGEIPPN
jgi:serine/threonine-protein kinase